MVGWECRSWCFARREGRSTFREIDSTGVERGVHSVVDVVVSWLGYEDDHMGFIVLRRVGYIHL